MHLVLGHPEDSCCAGVLAKLQERGLPVRLLPDLLAPPARLAWRLDDAGLDSRLALDGLSPETISSVLVRDAGWLDPAGWDPADHAYMQAKTQAALLAWLAGLLCPVINRACAPLWYRPRMPLLAWRPLLRRAGLPTPETNDPARARYFGRRLKADGAGGEVFTPLTGDGAWLVTDSDWSGLSTLQELAPVCLTEPHGQAQSACVVGDRSSGTALRRPRPAPLRPASSASPRRPASRWSRSPSRQSAAAGRSCLSSRSFSSIASGPRRANASWMRSWASSRTRRPLWARPRRRRHDPCRWRPGRRRNRTRLRPSRGLQLCLSAARPGAATPPATAPLGGGATVAPKAQSRALTGVSTSLTSPASTSASWDRTAHGAVIYKSVSGVCSILDCSRGLTPASMRSSARWPA